MSSHLSTNIVLENIVQSKMRGRVTFAENFSYSKLFNDPSGKGYQRPINKKRCTDFADYLSQGNVQTMDA